MMSHSATKWAFDQAELLHLKPGEQIVLLGLADCHNPAHGCFPSQAFLSRRTSLTDRAVRKNLQQLKARGLINWDAHFDDGHRRRSNRYRLAFEPDFVGAMPAEAAAVDTDCDCLDDHRPDDRDQAPEPADLFSASLSGNFVPPSYEPVRGSANRATGKGNTVAPRGTRISASWRPLSDDLDYGHRLGFSDDAIALEVEAFRNYWLAAAGRRALKADWSAAFRHWLTTETKSRARSPGDRRNGRRTTIVDAVLRNAGR
jgi:helix-turn-helix protein